MRPQVLTPGTNRKVTVLGALEVSTGRWVYRLGRRCAADFIALLDQVLQAFPRAPVIAVICDNDSIHHARHRLPGEASPPGAALRRPLQLARQPGRTGLGGTEELRGEHRRELARPPAADPLLLPRPLTRSDAGHRRALDQPMAAAGLRAELLECRLVSGRCGAGPPRPAPRPGGSWPGWLRSGHAALPRCVTR
jgi:hypothetical protein